MSQEVNKTNDAVQEEVKKSERDMANEAVSQSGMGMMLHSILFGAFAHNDKNDFTEEERKVLNSYSDALQAMISTFKGGK